MRCTTCSRHEGVPSPRRRIEGCRRSREHCENLQMVTQVETALRAEQTTSRPVSRHPPLFNKTNETMLVAFPRCLLSLVLHGVAAARAVTSRGSSDSAKFSIGADPGVAIFSRILTCRRHQHSNAGTCIVRLFTTRSRLYNLSFGPIPLPQYHPPPSQ